MKRRVIFESCSNCGVKIEDDENAVCIDLNNDLFFCNEDCLHEFFSDDIEKTESDYLKNRLASDILIEEFPKYDKFLELVLSDPDEVWMKGQFDDDLPISNYIGEFLSDSQSIFYVAIAYQTEEKPAFVLFHFPTTSLGLVGKYRVGDLIFKADETEDLNDENFISTLNGLTKDLFALMTNERSDDDIPTSEFPLYHALRDETLMKPEEVWRRLDELGNALLIYIKHFIKEDEPVAYVVVASEEESGDYGSIMFSFPTIDKYMIDRFRTGELTFSEEVENKED